MNVATHCPQCGNQVAPGSAFCNHCGKSLQPASTQNAPTVQAPTYGQGQYPYQIQTEGPSAYPSYAQPPFQQSKSPKKSKTPLLIGIAVALVVLLAGGGSFLFFSMRGSNSNSANTNNLTTPDNQTTAPLNITPYTYSGHSDSVLGVSWSPDGKWIASGSFDKSLHIYDALTGKQVVKCEDFPEFVRSVAWASDSKRVAAADTYGTLHVCEAATGKTLAKIDPTNETIYMNALAWSPDGKQIAIGTVSNEVMIYDAATMKQGFVYKGHKGVVWSLAWSPDGKHIASGDAGDISEEKAFLHIWNPAAGTLEVTYETRYTVDTIAWSPDSTRIVFNGLDENIIQVGSASSMKVEATYKGHTSGVTAVSWSPDGKNIASASSDNTVQVWNANNGEKIFTYEGHTGTVKSVSWAPDSVHLASASEDKTVQIWKIE